MSASLARAIRMAALGGGGGPPVLTLRTTNLLAAWRGNLLVSEDGTGVDAWEDFHGGHVASQSVDANRPSKIASGLGGLASIRYDSSASDSLVVPSLSSGGVTDLTFWYVVEPNITGSNQIFSDSQSGRVYVQNTPTRVRFNDGSFRLLATPAISTPTVLCIVCKTSDGSVTEYRNGIVTATNTYTPRSLGGQYGIGSSFTGSDSLDGDLSEHYVYTEAQGASEISEVSAFILQERGL